jgi:hypothetical protein
MIFIIVGLALIAAFVVECVLWISDQKRRNDRG